VADMLLTDVRTCNIWLSFVSVPYQWYSTPIYLYTKAIRNKQQYSHFCHKYLFSYKTWNWVFLNKFLENYELLFCSANKLLYSGLIKLLAKKYSPNLKSRDWECDNMLSSWGYCTLQRVVVNEYGQWWSINCHWKTKEAVRK
jgi:hypothetical protein